MIDRVETFVVDACQSVPGLDSKHEAALKDKCFTGDNESDHIRADEILIQILREIGMTKTADAYEAVGKWYA